MNPFTLAKKQDLAMNMTTNVYMSSTTKYVPGSIPSVKNKTPQKLKQQSFVYRPPSKSIKDLNQKNDNIQMKRSSNSNARLSGIQVSKISDLGQSSLFKGLDGLYNKPVQYTDRSKPRKSEQKQEAGNVSGRSEVNKNQNKFERRQTNNLINESVSSSQYKTSPRNFAGGNNLSKEEKSESSNSQIIVRKPLGRNIQAQQKTKQLEKSPLITRKNQGSTNTNTPKQQSFTTQTSSYVYKPYNKVNTNITQNSQINVSEVRGGLPIKQKKQQIKKLEPKIPTPINPNIYSRNRSRESKQVELNLEINTQVAYFKVQVKGGGDTKRSSTQKPNINRQPTQSQDKTLSNNSKMQPSLYPERKQNNIAKIQSPKKIQSDKNITKQVPYYQKPKTKAQLLKQTQPIKKQQIFIKQETQSITKKKSPPKVQNNQENQTINPIKTGYVYKPKQFQNLIKQTNQSSNINAQTKPNQTQNKATNLNLQTQKKPLPYQYGKKSKQQLINQSKQTTPSNQSIKIEAVTKQSTYSYPATKKPLNAQQKIYQESTVKQYSYPSRQNSNQQLNLQNNKSQEKFEQVKKVSSNSFKYNQLQKNSLQLSENSKIQSSNSNQIKRSPEIIINQQSNKQSQSKVELEVQKSIQNVRYPYNRKPIQTVQKPSQLTINNKVEKSPQSAILQQNSKYPQNIKVQQNKPEQIKPTPTIQNNKVSSSGYVYQPPVKKNLNASNTQQINNSIALDSSTNIIQNKNKPQGVKYPLTHYPQKISLNTQIQTSKETKLIGIQKPSPQKQQISPRISNVNTKQLQKSPQSKSTVYPVKNPSISPISMNQTNQTNSQIKSGYPYKKSAPQVIQKTEQTLNKSPYFISQARTSNKVIDNKLLSNQSSSTSVNRNNQQLNININNANAVDVQIIAKKPIPNCAYSILNILIKKKIKSTLKYSFNKISTQCKLSIKREKNHDFFVKKSFRLFQNYQNYLKSDSFTHFKKHFISILTSINTGNQNIKGSRITAIKPMSKSKQSKEDLQLSLLNTNMKKPLCLKLFSLFNAKVRSVFKQKLVISFQRQNYIARKQPIFQSLFKIFMTKSLQHLQNSFKKIKFAFSYVPKNKDDDVLPLFEQKNKKSKLQIVKFFQNIYPNTTTINTSSSRISLLQKTPDKKIQAKQQISKYPSNKTLQSPNSKIESQKINTLKTRIQNIQKQINQQQKITNDKQRQITSKKLQIKRQMNSLKKENQIRKKENQQLKEKLKKYQSFNNFSDQKDVAILGSQIQIDPFSRKQGLSNRQNILTSDSSEFLNALCEIYVNSLLKGQSLSNDLSNVDQFLKICSQSTFIVTEGLNYLLNPHQSEGYPTIRYDQQLLQKISKSKQLILEKILVEQNLLLKCQISTIQEGFTDQKPTNCQLSPKVLQQVDTMKNLTKNYIKQRYLWEWIRKSIQKI